MGDARFFARNAPHALADIAIAAGGIAPRGRENVRRRRTSAVGGTGSGQLSRQSTICARARTDLGRRRHRASGDAEQGSDRHHSDRHSGDLRRLGARRRAVSSHATATPGYSSFRRGGSDAQVDASAEIGPYVVVDAGAEIGPGCRIGPFVSVGQGVTIGRDCRIGAHASLSHALLGSRVYIYPGARIGQEGFSFAATKTGFLSIPQLGRVIVEDDVEVGANTTIDRGSTHDTVIGAGTRIDNLVQIGHNVRLGTLLCHRGAGWHRGVHDPRGLRAGRRSGGDGGASAHRSRQPDRRPERSHFRRPRRLGVARKSGAAAERVFPPGRHPEANDAAAQVAAIPELCCHITPISAMLSRWWT